MSVLRRIFKGQPETTPHCPHCAEVLTPTEIADGLCARCAAQFAQHAARANGAAASPAHRNAGQLSSQQSPVAANGTHSRPGQMIAPYIPATPSGSVAEHRCTQSVLLQRDLDHARALLAEVERQRDYLLAELEAARHRLDATAEERAELLRLLNAILKSRTTAQTLITPPIDLPLLRSGR